MKKVFLVHGFTGSPNGGWRPWLMAELDKQGVYACALAMPTPDMPVRAEWVEEIKRHVVTTTADDEVYLVGHSLGVAAILRYAESAPARRDLRAVLVSGPSQARIENPAVDGFVADPFDWVRINECLKHARVIHGDDDPLVPLEHAYRLAEGLQSPLFIVNGGKHLTAREGWRTLPICLQVLEELFSLK